MAERDSDLCHAAGQPVYEVHEGLKHHPGLDLGLRFSSSSFLDSAEYALEFLDEHDPKREGRVSALEILRVEGAARDRLALRLRRFAEGPSGPEGDLGLRRQRVARA